MMLDPRQRGYQPHYRRELRCPACGGGSWHVGRRSAECARCGAALPLAHPTEEHVEETMQ